MCHCFTFYQVKTLKEKLVILHVFSFILLPLAILCLYMSTIQEAPWFQLSLYNAEKVNENYIILPSTHISPISLSFVGLHSRPLLMHSVKHGTTSMPNHTHHVTTGASMDFVHPPSISVINYPFNTTHSDQHDLSTLKPSHFFSIDEPLNNTQNKDSLWSHNFTSPIILSTWSLKKVQLIIPSFHNLSHTISYESLPEDPFIQTALSVAGIQRQLIDMQQTTDLTYSLGVFSLFLCFVALTFLLLFPFVELYKTCCVYLSSQRRNTHPTSLLDSTQIGYSQNTSTVARNSVRVHDWDTSISNQLLQPLSSRVYMRTDPTIHSLSKNILISTGILSLISSSVLFVAYYIWVVHSLKDSQSIFAAIAHFLGTSAVQWLDNHSHFSIDIGIVYFVTTIILLFFIGIVILFSDLTFKHTIPFYEVLQNDPPCLRDTLPIPSLIRKNDTVPYPSHSPPSSIRDHTDLSS